MQGEAGGQQHAKLADDKKELDKIADKQQNAEAAEQLKTHTQQPTLEAMPNTEGDPGPPKTAPASGPKPSQAAGQSQPANVRKVDNPEVHAPSVISRYSTQLLHWPVQCLYRRCPAMLVQSQCTAADVLERRLMIIKSLPVTAGILLYPFCQNQKLWLAFIHCNQGRKVKFQNGNRPIFLWLLVLISDKKHDRPRKCQILRTGQFDLLSQNLHLHSAADACRCLLTQSRTAADHSRNELGFRS